MFDFYNFTYCIRCDNLELIEQVLTRILEQEGCHRIPLPSLSIDVEKLYRNPWLLCDEIWTISLFIGATGWTIVKTLPEEILCRRAIGAERPRLSELAMQISSDAFYLGVYNSHKILMEVDAQGGISTSGEDDSVRFEEGMFFDERINLREAEGFTLLQTPQEEIEKAERAISQEQRQRYDKWEEKFLEEYARSHYPRMTPSELEQWKARWKGTFLEPEKQLQFDKDEEWQQLYSELLYEGQSFAIGESGSLLFEQALERLLGGTPSYWYLTARELIYRAYTRPQQFAADGARLLHFQPVVVERKLDEREFWEAISNETDTVTESEIDDIPFMRPVYSRTTWANQLCDEWELEANCPWEGVKQFKL